MKQWKKPLGAVLLALSVFGAGYAVRVSRAHFLYLQAKYGVAAQDPRLKLSYCRRALSLYRFNYRLCMTAAEAAYYLAPGDADFKTNPELAASRFWCEEGLALNPFQRELRWLMSQFHRAESPAKAIEYWKQFTDWDFWSPYNHSVLADLYARSGDVESAEKELRWIEGSELYESTRAMIAGERAKARQPK